MSEADARAAFERLYEQTYERTRRYVLTKCGNPQDVADILQETYTQLLLTLYRRKTIRTPEAFVLHLAKKQIARHYSAMTRLHDRLLPPLSAEAEERPTDVCVEDMAVDRALLLEIAVRLAQKPPQVQRVFYLYYTLDMPLADIACTLHTTPSDVKNKLYRTLRELRQIYAKEEELHDGKRADEASAGSGAAR